MTSGSVTCAVGDPSGGPTPEAGKEGRDFKANSHCSTCPASWHIYWQISLVREMNSELLTCGSASSYVWQLRRRLQLPS